MIIIEYLNKKKKSFDWYAIDDGDFEMRYKNKAEFIDLHGFKLTKKYKPETIGNGIVFRKK